MSQVQDHVVALGMLDNAVAAFVADSVGAYEVGKRLARTDAARLIAMAAGLTTDARRWLRGIDTLEISTRRNLQVEDVVTLVVEAVFDECLTAEALNVLVAAIPIAFTRD